MRLSTFILVGLLGTASAASTGNDVLNAKGLDALALYVAKHGYADAEKCTLETAAVRREWSTLSKSQKLNYIDSVKCLAKKPARTPAAIAAGAKSRHDDFTVTHILQTLTIHGTGNFLAWHRYYIWAFEQALRDECGYKGYLPYNNWSKWAHNPLQSPLFDGSATSISGDGAFVAGRNVTCHPTEDVCLIRFKPSNGGGCVTSGPFKDWSINLGPVQTFAQGAPPNPQADGLGYNPRCLSRDISIQAANETKDEYVVSLIENNKDIFNFLGRMTNFYPESMGVHTGGHYTIGGDAGSDFFNSPADPAFYFHHGMIDRVWSTWQNLDLATRQNALSGTITFQNIPPSRNTSLEDVIDMGYVGAPNVTIADVMSTIAGPLCYVYA
ncbi:Di-copper centre-containing protein [Plenodomus tracheiphilus IPT5]|uniref:Di-copper centre-containing protein n=1 Tax=Plenodomus tracheiphilus IPT5 TaxID=1408161 RepID=A0A6A7AZY7_9PLEO|nr:Di-copper centre-containing protein [Plenodomus tracheiphilus IPT5]